MNPSFVHIFIFTIFIFATSCSKKIVDAASTTRSLYVASGLCYSGTGNTTFTAATASNIIYKVSLSTGTADEIIADYTTASEAASSTPTSIVDFDADYLLALVENATTTSARRIEKVPKVTTGSKALYYGNTTALSAALRYMHRDATSGALLISKSTAVEKVNSTPSRMTIGASTAWISAPAGNCSTSATYISSIQILSNGKILYTHANAAQNKIGMISAEGYTAAADCIISSAISAPVAAAFPTSSLYLPEYNQYLVVYAGIATTADLNSIYAYDVDETTNALTGATNAYEDSSVLYGGSAITRDEETGYIYVATSNSTSTTVANYNIEKFTYDATAKTLTRVGTSPFATGWTGSKCISSMFVGD